MLTSNMKINAAEDRVYPTDTDTWSNLPSHWDDWSSWYTDIPDVGIFFCDYALRPGPADYFNLTIETVANGIVSYEIYTSPTGEFTGEETTHTIDNGATSIEGFFGIAFLVAVKVQRVNGINTIDSILITADNATVTETQSNIDTSTLGGTQTARIIPTVRSFSSIREMDISVHETTAYALDLYVSNYATSKTLIPRVVDKTASAPKIALLGIDGSPKDGVIDITFKGLPEQYMQGNNLLVR